MNKVNLILIILWFVFESCSTSNYATIKTITSIMQKNIPHFKKCYPNNLSTPRERRLFGGVGFKFKIGKDGRVTSSKITNIEKLPTRIERCLLNHLNTIQFPKSDDIVIFDSPKQNEPDWGIDR